MQLCVLRYIIAGISVDISVEDQRCYITHAFIRNDHHGTQLRSGTLPRLASCLLETNSACTRAVALYATSSIALWTRTTIDSQQSFSMGLVLRTSTELVMKGIFPYVQCVRTQTRAPSSLDHAQDKDSHCRYGRALQALPVAILFPRASEHYLHD
jgi:hypothetical protein